MDMEEILLAKLFAEQVVSEGLVDADTLKFEEVQTLPSASSAKPNVIYLKKNGFSGHYDMYVLLNGKIQQLDDTSVDLSGYAKKEEIPTKTSQLANDSDFLTKSIVPISLLQHVSLEDYQKIMNGESLEGNLESLFDEITQVVKSNKIPVLLIATLDGKPILASINNFVFNNTAEAVINQIIVSLFTNGMDESGDWFLYVWNFARDGRISRKKIKPDDESQVYFDVHQSGDGNEVTYDFSFNQIAGLLEDGKQVYLRLYLMGAPIYVILEFSGGLEIGENYSFLFASSLKTINNSMGFVTALVQEDNITIDMAPYQIGDRIREVYFEGNELVIRTMDDAYSVEIPTLEGPEGPEGPQGVGISDIGDNGDGDIRINLDNGEYYDINGVRGIGIDYISDNGNGTMTIYLDNGLSYDIDIPEGQEGVGIDHIENSEYGSITIYLTNGDNYQVALTTKAEAVADAAGEAPTAEEFNALLTSLRNAGILST